jgi:hypothetical protein
MSNHVGVLDFLALTNESDLKHAALVFDKVVMFGVGGLRMIEGSLPDRATDVLRRDLALLEFLQEHGVVMEANPAALFPQSKAQSEEAVLKKVLTDPQFSDFLEKLNSISPEELSTYHKGAYDRTARRVAAYYSANMQWDAVVLGSGVGAAADMLDAGSDVVVNDVLPEMPIPDDATAWERIIDFRNDPDSRIKFNRLHMWTHEAARSGKSAQELRDELRYLLDEYKAHMRLHEMKVRSGVVQTVVSAAATALEGLLRFKPTSAADAIFSVSAQRAALLEAEKAAPGRALAYIVDANRVFTKST